MSHKRAPQRYEAQRARLRSTAAVTDFGLAKHLAARPHVDTEAATLTAQSDEPSLTGKGVAEPAGCAPGGAQDVCGVDVLHTCLTQA